MPLKVFILLQSVSLALSGDAVDAGRCRPGIGDTACGDGVAAEIGAVMLQTVTEKPHKHDEHLGEDEPVVLGQTGLDADLERVVKGLSPRLAQLLRRTQALVRHRHKAIDPRVMKDIRDVVDQTMMAEILNAVKRDQKDLDDAAKALNNCTVPSDELNNILQELKGHGGAIVKCANMLAKKEAANKTACDAMVAARDLIKVPEICTTGSINTQAYEKVDDDLDSCMAFFRDATIKYREAAETCADAYVDLLKHKEQCKPLREKLADGVCMGYSETLSKCHEYSAMYEVHVQNFQQVNKTVRAGLAGRRDEYKGVKLILCLVDVLGQELPATKVDGATRKCLETEPDYSPLKINWPDLNPMMECGTDELDSLMRGDGQMAKHLPPGWSLKKSCPQTDLMKGLKVNVVSTSKDVEDDFDGELTEEAMKMIIAKIKGQTAQEDKKEDIPSKPPKKDTIEVPEDLPTTPPKKKAIEGAEEGSDTEDAFVDDFEGSPKEEMHDTEGFPDEEMHDTEGFPDEEMHDTEGVPHEEPIGDA